MIKRTFDFPIPSVDFENQTLHYTLKYPFICIFCLLFFILLWIFWIRYFPRMLHNDIWIKLSSLVEINAKYLFPSFVIIYLSRLCLEL